MISAFFIHINRKPLIHRRYLCSAKDFYSILGIKPHASQDDIRQAFLKLSKKHHPDKSDGGHQKFVLINEAYTTLSKPDARQKYDSQFYGRNTGGNPVHSPSASSDSQYTKEYERYWQREQERQAEYWRRLTKDFPEKDYNYYSSPEAKRKNLVFLLHVLKVMLIATAFQLLFIILIRKLWFPQPPYSHLVLEEAREQSKRRKHRNYVQGYRLDYPEDVSEKMNQDGSKS